MSTKIYQSKPSDKLLVKDPTITQKSRVLNNNNTTSNDVVSFLSNQFNVSSTRNALESILGRSSVFDVLLDSKRESALESLSMGAKRDLINNLKRLAPSQYSVLLDNAEDLIRGKKKLFSTESGSRYYGLEDLPILKELFDIKNQWDRYQTEKEREVVQYTDIETEAVLVAGLSDSYIKLDNPTAVIELLDTLDEEVKIDACKRILRSSVVYDQLTVTSYIVDVLSPAYILSDYPQITNHIFRYYRQSSPYDQNIPDYQYILSLCGKIDPDFIYNRYASEYLNGSLFRGMSKDAFRLINGIEDTISNITYAAGKTISVEKLKLLLYISRDIRDIDHLEEMSKQFPYAL